ncbi:MAG: Gfo/Idh/MocA family oxidoreductase [Burkholderiales bacterium]
MKKFALIGAAGYVAPRNMNAIKETGSDMLAAMDRCDSVGIIDSYFPNADFFTEFERFDRHVYKLGKQGSKIDYISICSPNYLHDAHIRWALRSGCDVICEKPLVLNPWNLDALEEIEKETGKRVYNVLQLRVHEAIINLKNRIDSEYKNKKEKYDIDLTYMTSRGKWYFIAWKGDLSKSGGVASNIGIHFFDMLIWIFGQVKHQEVHYSEPLKKMAGYIELERANVRWFLSVDNNDLPDEVKAKGKKTYRSITIDGQELEFSEGFTDLHTIVYKDILNGCGYGINDARPSIDLVYDIRNADVIGLNEKTHPLAAEKLNGK